MSNAFRCAAALLATLFLCAGCASVRMASTEQDADAKSFRTDSKNATIYVYRHETKGAASTLPVIMDGRKIGDTAARTFIRLEVAPGEHTLVSRAENDAVLSVRADAGKHYFVWQQIHAGMSAPRSMLSLVDEATGMKAVQECALIEQWF
jgi:hypothetical protein